jgi:hypothetical protein
MAKTLMPQNPEVLTRLPELLTRVQDLVTKHITTNFPSLVPDRIEVEYGPRYARIVSQKQTRRFLPVERVEDGQRMVYGFVDLTNGDILMAAGWKAPAKNGARSNIKDEDYGMSGCGPHGVNYKKVA